MHTNKSNIAVQITEKETIQLKNVPIPTQKVNETILTVTFCGICKTDAKMWRNGHRDLRMPRILGHEFCGIDKKNNRFVVWPGKSCAQCHFCKNNAQNLCDNIEIIGFHRDGGMSHFCSVPTTSLIPIAKNDFWGKELCFSEPLGCAINGIEQLTHIKQPTSNQELLILGGGILGLLTAIASRSYGFTPIIYENSITQCNKIKSICLQNSIKLINDIDEFSGRPVMYCLNAHSNNNAISNGFNALQKQGHFCYFSGIANGEFPTKILNLIHYKQLTVVGAYGCRKQDMEKAVTIISQTPQLFTQLIEKEITLNDVQHAFNKIVETPQFRYIINLNTGE